MLLNYGLKKLTRKVDRMSKLMLNPEFNLYEKNGMAFCSSRQIADEFSRQHKHVLETITNLTQPTSGLSKEFILLNFKESVYRDDSGKKNREFLMTKDGFTIVVMEFKTSKARAFKERYIKRFNDMEAFIKNLFEAKADFPEFTQAIMEAHEEPKHYHFSNELDMINRIVLGMSSKKFKEANNLVGVSSIRPYLTPIQIENIRNLQRIDIGLIVAISDFHERKRILTEQLAKKLLLQERKLVSA